MRMSKEFSPKPEDTVPGSLLVIHSLEQALNPSIREARSNWESKVSEKAVKAAADITAHLNNQKFIMLGLEDDLTEPESESSGLSKKLV